MQVIIDVLGGDEKDPVEEKKELQQEQKKKVMIDIRYLLQPQLIEVETKKK